MAKTVDWEKLVVRVFQKAADGSEQYKGTAFLLNDQYLLSARHVIEEGREAFAANHNVLVLRNGPWTGDRYLHEAPIPHDNKSIDIALLRLRLPSNKPVNYWRLADLENLAGSKVNIAGFDDEEIDASVPEFHVLGENNKFNTFELQEKIQHGKSGGPVFIGDRLVGILYARTDAPEPQKDQNKTFIYPYSAFRAFLIAQGVVPANTPIQDSRGKKSLSPDERAALIDRQDQWDSQIIKRLEADASKKTFAFVIAGVKEEWPEAFKYRFREKLEGTMSASVVLNFSDTDAQHWECAFWKCLLNHFPRIDARETVADEQLKPLLSAELAQSPTPLFFYCLLDPVTSKRIDFIQQIIRFWESLKPGAGKQHCLLLVHGILEKGFLSLGERKVEQWRQALAAKLAKESPQILVSQLLSPSREDINYWSSTLLEDTDEKDAFDEAFARMKGKRIPHLTVKQAYVKIAKSKS